MSQAGKTSLARNILTGLVLAAIVTGHLALLFFNARDLCDDAMISARYARNLATGRGLVYNLAPPDAKPVEGYSNFLWVMGMSAGERLNLPVRETTAGMGMFFSAICLVTLFLWVKRETGSLSLSLLSAVTLAVWPAWIVWSVQGLETPMFAAFMLLALSQKKPGPAAYLFALLAALTRPDGLIAVAALLLHNRKSWKSAAWFAVPFTLYTLWRFVHFGSFLPNTFYAKTGLGLAGVMVGMKYLIGFSLSQWPVTLLLLIALFSWKAKPDLRGFIFAAGAYLAFIVSVGGDFMPDYRFFMHIAPLMIGAGATGAAALFKKRGTTAAAVLLLAAILWNGLALRSYIYKDSPEKDWHRNQAMWYGLTSSWFLNVEGRHITVAAGDIGYLGYVTGIDRIIDTNGLVDSHIARLPGAAGFNSDPAYVLEQKPDYVIVMIHYFDNGAVIGHSGFGRAVLSSGLLEKHYSLAAEVMGFKSEETSHADGVKRKSTVKFRIYQNRNRP